jgi:hypothetical protein
MSAAFRYQMSRVPNGWWIILATILAWVLTAAAGSVVIKAIMLFAR